MYPVRSAARSEAKLSEVVRCRHGTAKGSELRAVPDQQCTTERDTPRLNRAATQALRAALHPGHSVCDLVRAGAPFILHTAKAVYNPGNYVMLGEHRCVCQWS